MKDVVQIGIRAIGSDHNYIQMIEIACNNQADSEELQVEMIQKIQILVEEIINSCPGAP